MLTNYDTKDSASRAARCAEQRPTARIYIYIYISGGPSALFLAARRPKQPRAPQKNIVLIISDNLNNALSYASRQNS